MWSKRGAGGVPLTTGGGHGTHGSEATAAWRARYGARALGRHCEEKGEEERPTGGAHLQISELFQILFSPFLEQQDLGIY